MCIAFERWDFRTADAVSALIGDAWVKRHVERLYVVNQDDIGRGLLPGCHVSLVPSLIDHRIHVPAGYARTYNHVEPQGEGGGEGSPLLFSFRGTDLSHAVRRRMVETLRGDPLGRVTVIRQAFHSHDDVQRRAYASEIHDSAFVLCPRGWSPTTYRLFETMSAARCPVIISDDWVPIPGIDWGGCSLRVAERDIASIPQILRERWSEAAALGRAACAAWQAHFSEAARFDRYLDAILALDARRPAYTRQWSFHLARWRSLQFRWANGWTLPQRCGRGIKRIVNWPRRRAYTPAG
ncbi:MAG: exostosin family protein [Planctomycetes bacterium]|nr:exostosin family protein [Planctomycetota bacterium]